ncbi:MAG: PAAR domain-containing protein [Polyangiaceae bacterium]|nr:PAAR domain-containing protein [Polyangiaceae bacterium]
MTSSSSWNVPSPDDQVSGITKAIGPNTKGAIGRIASDAKLKHRWSNTSGNAFKDSYADLVNKIAPLRWDSMNPKASGRDKATQLFGAAAFVANVPAAIGYFSNDLFARATNRIAKALPSLPAATMGSMVLGIPHIHREMPPPLPAFGAIVTGCPSVLIGGIPAARCGDFGIGATCGSGAPVFEVITGSSKVFIGGLRAARLVDFTLQCTKSSSKGKGAGKDAKIAEGVGKDTKIAEDAGEDAAQGAKAAGKIKTAMNKVSRVLDAVTDPKDGSKIKAFKHIKNWLSLGAGVVDLRFGIADASAHDDKAHEQAADSAKTAAGSGDPAKQGEAASDAAEASAADFAIDMLALDVGMDIATMAMAAWGALMGADPGTPPCLGAVILCYPSGTLRALMHGDKSVLTSAVMGTVGGMMDAVGGVVDAVGGGMHVGGMRGDGVGMHAAGTAAMRAVGGGMHAGGAAVVHTGDAVMHAGGGSWVLIGGFPMPSWTNIARGVNKGLKKLAPLPKTPSQSSNDTPLPKTPSQSSNKSMRTSDEPNAVDEPTQASKKTPQLMEDTQSSAMEQTKVDELKGELKQAQDRANRLNGKDAVANKNVREAQMRLSQALWNEKVAKKP